MTVNYCNALCVKIRSTLSLFYTFHDTWMIYNFFLSSRRLFDAVPNCPGQWLLTLLKFKSAVEATRSSVIAYRPRQVWGHPTQQHTVQTWKARLSVVRQRKFILIMEIKTSSVGFSHPFTQGFGFGWCKVNFSSLNSKDWLPSENPKKYLSAFRICRCSLFITLAFLFQDSWRFVFMCRSQHTSKHSYMPNLTDLKCVPKLRNAENKFAELNFK